MDLTTFSSTLSSSLSLSLSLFDLWHYSNLTQKEKERTKKKLKNHPQDPSFKEEIITNAFIPYQFLLYPNEIKVEEHLGEVGSKVSEAPLAHLFDASNDRASSLQTAFKRHASSSSGRGNKPAPIHPLSPFVLHGRESEFAQCRAAQSRNFEILLPPHLLLHHLLPHSSPPFPLASVSTAPRGRGSRHFRK